ncbi:MAG: pseudouridine synthase [Lachnospiraceae bacterium]|nr:pseudouridine synthase [Lachnospiraceae bacterium]
MQEDAIRINKYLSSKGVCSRREADRLLDQGQIKIDGEVAVKGAMVKPGQIVEVNGKVVSQKEVEKLWIALNKPRGIVCTTSNKDRAQNVVDYIGLKERVYPVGRLDKDSEGLLLLTNQGEAADKLLRASNYHEKEYIVTVNKTIEDSFLRRMEKGVPILDTVTRPCKCVRLGHNKFKIIITQGLNRQIRRMCQYFHVEVVSLQRVRIMNIKLGNLKYGEYRKLTPKEIKELEQALK